MAEELKAVLPKSLTLTLNPGKIISYFQMAITNVTSELPQALTLLPFYIHVIVNMYHKFYLKFNVLCIQSVTLGDQNSYIVNKQPVLDVLMTSQKRSVFYFQSLLPFIQV